MVDSFAMTMALPMIGPLKILEHSEVVGDESHSRAYQGLLPDTYETKLRDFFVKLQGLPVR